MSLADEIKYGRACKGGSIGSLVVYVKNNKRKMICETFTFLALNKGKGSWLGEEIERKSSFQFLCNLRLGFLRADH